jgi:hypothetical protein
MLELVRISEVNLGKGSTSTRFMDDLSHDSLYVSLSLSKVIDSVLRSGNSVVLVGFVDSVSTTLSLSSDNSAHLY